MDTDAGRWLWLRPGQHEPDAALPELRAGSAVKSARAKNRGCTPSDPVMSLPAVPGRGRVIGCSRSWRHRAGKVVRASYSPWKSPLVVVRLERPTRRRDKAGPVPAG